MIDLHVHSTASDGTFTPEELAREGREFALMALTDHDNSDGVADFLAESHRLDVSAPRLAGVELSVNPGEGYHKFHLLGLGFDPAAVPLQKLMRVIREGREDRNQRTFRKLAELGMPLEYEEVRKYAQGAVMARPHFARALVAHGWAKDVKDAFDRILGDGCPAHLPRFRAEPADAIAAIHTSGGIAVMAHPRFWTSDPQALRRGLARLREVGLDGIEAYYQINAPHETLDHLAAARELNLLITAGSDFHGANKTAITLGMNIPDEKDLIDALLAKIAVYR